MKRIIKIAFIIILLITIYFLILIFINNKNHKYLDSIKETILENYNLDSKITYTNLHGNYYIITTKKEVIVLNKEYEEILKKDINTLAPNQNNHKLIYKNNKLMYEETLVKKDTLTIKYYDATNNKPIKETNMEKK